MGHRQIYSNSPLALTIVELRHTASPALTDTDQASLKSLLAADFPLLRPALQVTGVTVSTTGVTPDQTFNPRYMTRDSTAAITYRRDAIVVETTKYKRRSVLREVLKQAVEARQKVAPVDGVERLGIRYINELRAPDIEGPCDWTHWISAPLTSIAGLQTARDGSPQTWQGITVFGTPSVGVVLRHGNFEGYAVEPTGDLRRPTPLPGPFYLLDLDCFWVPEGDMPPPDWELIEPRYNDAGLSAYELFEQLITDRYRTEVLKRDE